MMIIKKAAHPLAEFVKNWRDKSTVEKEHTVAPDDRSGHISETEEVKARHSPYSESVAAEHQPLPPAERIVRDKYQIIEDVRKYAASHVHVNHSAGAQHPIIQLVHLPARLLHLFTRWLSHLRQDFSGWHLAIPALTITAIILVIKPLIKSPSEPAANSSWDATLPSQLQNHSRDLINSVKTEFTQPLPQGKNISNAAIAFQMGQALADLEVADAAKNSQRSTLLMQQITRLGSRLGISLPQLDKSALSKIEDITQSTTKELSETPELAILMKLGYWLEATRYSLQIADEVSGGDALAKQFQAIGMALPDIEKAIKNYPTPYHEFSTLFSPRIIDLTTADGRASFSLQLNKTITAFRNA